MAAGRCAEAVPSGQGEAVTEDAVRGALIAARDYMLRAANPDVTYGYFPGGDPRDFNPDPECCTPEEMARHKAACEEWDRGDKTEHERHHHKAETLADGRAVIASYPGAFGLGTYSIRDEEAEDVLDQVQAALALLDDE